MQLVLVMFRAEGERRSFSVTREATIIGRREDCDLRIPVSEVSRKHCRIIKDGDAVRVEDLGSSNGTYHNGQRIQGSVEVHPGDSIEVGPVVFVVQVDGVPADDDLQPITDRAGHSQHPLVDDSAFGGEVTETPANADSFAGAQGETAAEAHPLESSAAGDSRIPMTGDEPTLDIDLSEDHEHAGQPLSEDELLLDLNTHDEPEKP